VGNPKAKEEKGTPSTYTYTTPEEIIPEGSPSTYPCTTKKEKLIVKFPFGKKKKRSPKKSPKKSRKKSPKRSLMVRIPLDKLRAPVTLVKKTKTLADLKMGLAQKKMERAMRCPIGSSRTSDTALPSFSHAFGGMIPFTPLAASTPKSKYQCPQFPLVFNLKSSLDQHLKTVHQGAWPRRPLN
jgi:hypothetical protein